MIRTAHIRLFRCLREIRLELSPLTILMGPNASGKSSILRALDPSKSLAIGDYWRHQTSLEVSFEFTFEHGAPAYLAKKDLRVLRDPGRPWRDYSYQLLQLEVPAMRLPNIVQPERRLQHDGANLTNVVASLKRRQQLALAEQLCELVPVYDDVDVRPYETKRGQQRLLFQDRWAEDLWYTADDVSDGTMRLLAYLLVQHQGERPDLLAIEEPERGLHPYLLDSLLRVLRALSQGADGRPPIQVVMATHSPVLLDLARPDEVRFVTRSPRDGSAHVERPDSADWERTFHRYREVLATV
jgi:predicted ATPase